MIYFFKSLLEVIEKMKLEMIYVISKSYSFSVSAMQPEVDEDDVDFGSDVDLPLSDTQGQAPVQLRERTVSGGDDSVSASKPFARGSSFHSSKRWRYEINDSHSGMIYS